MFSLDLASQLRSISSLYGNLPYGVLIEGTICVKPHVDYSCESRYITERFEGEELAYLTETMDMQVVINKYMGIALDTQDPTMSECPCGGSDDCECSFTVTAYDKGETASYNVKRQLNKVGATAKPKYTDFSKISKTGAKKPRTRAQEGPAALTPDRE